MNNNKIIAWALSIAVLFSSAINNTRQAPEKPFELEKKIVKEKNQETKS